jgi:UDP-glucose 4-epimerase
VLGGTGLLGAEIARRALDGGAPVTILARHAPDPSCARLLAGARVVLGDAADRAALCEALDGAGHVVHALGTPHPAASATAPHAQHDAELPTLDRLLVELRRRPGVALTFLSSGGAVYGDAATLPVPEPTSCHPRSPYGVTKLAAERRVLLAAADDGLAARVLRVGNAYGARQRHDTGQGVVAAMLHAARTGTPIRLYGDGGSVRDYVDARDVADAVVRLAAIPRGPRVLNVGTGIGHRVLDVQAEVEALSGARLEVWHAPARLTDVSAVVLDLARLHMLLDWHPRTLRAGIADAWRAVCTAVPVVERVPVGVR